MTTEVRPDASAWTTSPKPGLSLPSFFSAQSSVIRPGRRRLDQRRHEDVIGAEAHAEAAKRRPAGLVERLHVVGDVAAVDQAEILDELEGDAAADAGDLVGVLQVDQRLQQRLDLEIDEALGARRDLVAGRAGQLLVGEQDRRAASARPRLRPACRSARRSSAATPSEPSAMSPLAEAEKRSARVSNSAASAFCAAAFDRLGVLAAGALVGGEAEPLQFADMVAFDEDRAGWADFGFKHRIFSEAPHEDGSPAVYEAFRQPLMQRIRQSVFDFARLFLPVCRIGKPSRPVGHEGPGADLGDPVRQRVDVALGASRRGAPARPCSSRRHGPSGRGRHRSRRSGRHAGPARSCGSRAARRLPTEARRARARSPGRGCPGRATDARAPARRRPAARGSGPRPAPASRSSASARRGAKNRSRRCAIAAPSPDRNRALSIFSTSSSSSGSTWPVTPNVPSRRWRPARPAIWPSSAAERSRY